MKILVVNTLYAPNKIGGAEKSVQLLCERLVILGYTVKVICLDKQSSIYTLNGVNIRAIKIKNNYWPFENDYKSKTQKLLWHIKDYSNSKYDDDFKEIITNYKPDILFTNNLSGFSTSIWSVAKECKIKIVHTLRDYYLQCIKSTKFKNNINCSQCLGCKVLTNVKKLNSAKIDYLVGISNYILKDHIKNGYFRNIPNETIYNGFNIVKVKPKTVKDKKISFGFIGQINEAKGIELLLRCLLEFKNKNWELLIAGKVEGDYIKRLKSINNSKKIKYLGYVQSSSFFEKIDLLIVPSLWHEPFGRVVLEAFINGVPVLASKAGGVPELMLTNKDFLFESSEKKLIQKLEEIILNPKILDNFNFDSEFKEKFSIEKSIEKYLDVFKKLMK